MRCGSAVAQDCPNKNLEQNIDEANALQKGHIIPYNSTAQCRSFGLDIQIIGPNEFDPVALASTPSSTPRTAHKYLSVIHCVMQ